MTVGIGSICKEDGEPCVIVAADRMVTVGTSGGVEYEDTSTKIEPFVDNEDVTAMLVGSGSSTAIDSIINHGRELVAANKGPNNAYGSMRFALSAYKEIVRETISNRVLSPIGYELDDLRNDDVTIPTEIQRSVVSQGREIRKRYGESVQIMLAAVDKNQASLYKIAGNDYTNFSDIGYSVIGSGAQSARLTFIRREYDSDCDSREALFTVVDAKSQAEERQGVGQKVDLVKITRGNKKIYSDEEIDDLRENLSKINEQEQQAREQVIRDWDTNH